MKYVKSPVLKKAGDFFVSFCKQEMNFVFFIDIVYPAFYNEKVCVIL